MILFDVNSFPSGLNIEMWLDLYNKGVILYDSIHGHPPELKDDTATLIDINHMTDEQIKIVIESANVIMKKEHVKQLEENNIAIENTSKLVRYLKKINGNCMYAI